jgi:hypothetical protein
MSKQTDYTRIDKAPGLAGDYYRAWHRGTLIGIFNTWQEAFDALWQGPILDDLLHYQNELYIKRIVQRNAEQLRKALEQQDATAKETRQGDQLCISDL